MKQIISLSILISIMSAGCGNKAQKLSQAQEVFRQGSELTSTGSVPDMLKAKELFKQSVTIDSTFAPGYAQIAITNASLAGDWNYLSPEKAYPEAIIASDRSIALDENLAAGYLAKALIAQYHYWNWSEAEANYEKGIALDPSNVELIIKSAWLKYFLNKQAEAQEMIEKAGQLDPDSPGFRSFLVFDLVYSERFDEARKYIMNDIDANPDDPYNYWVMSILCSKEGSHNEAIDNLNIQIPLMKGDIADELALSGYNYGRLGKTEEALAKLAALDELAAGGVYVSPVAKAWVFCGINDKDSAMHYLEKAYQQRDNRMGLDLLSFSFIYEPIAGDPEFTELLKKSNLQ